MRIVSATEFRAKCLSLLDEVEKTGAAIIITKRGHSVAVLGPAAKDVFQFPRNSWARKAQIAGDIVNTDMSDPWDSVHGK